MYNWYEVVKEKDNHIISISSDWLIDKTLVYSGSTDPLFIGSKRYENFENIFSHIELKTESYFLADEGMTQISDAYSEKLYINNLYEDYFKLYKEWLLSYNITEFETKIEEVEAEILKFFGSIGLVKKIYSFEYDKDSFHFQILTNNSKYDRSLMMKLFDLEYEIENKFENVYLTFEYIPKVYESESDVVIEDAKLIYKKEFKSQYELTASTYTTSTPQQEVCISHILVPAPL